jgi:ferredoxin
MAKFKIIQKRELCIGCGACAQVCPANWEMVKDGKSKPKKAVVDTVGCNQTAADGCPVHCISIVKA